MELRNAGLCRRDNFVLSDRDLSGLRCRERLDGALYEATLVRYGSGLCAV